MSKNTSFIDRIALLKVGQSEVKAKVFDKSLSFAKISEERQKLLNNCSGTLTALEKKTGIKRTCYKTGSDYTQIGDNVVIQVIVIKVC